MTRSRKKYGSSNWGKIILVVLVISVVFGFVFDFAANKVEHAIYPKPQQYAESVQKYSDRFNVPENAHSLSLAYNGEFINRAYSLSVELYFKQLHNVVESTSNILEMLNTGFDYQSGLLVGKGRNYGLNLMFCKNKGCLLYQNP